MLLLYLFKCFVSCHFRENIWHKSHRILCHHCLASLFCTARSAQYISNMFVNSLRPRKNRHNFAHDVFKCNLLNENVWIPIKLLLEYVPKGPINNIPALVQIMAWRRTGDKPLSEPMMIQFNDAYMRHSASLSYYNCLHALNTCHFVCQPSVFEGWSQQL